MKNLLILRHASPMPQGTEGTDHSRQLTQQGEAEARIQGGFLREAGIVPDLIAASSAVRAATTAQLLCEGLTGGASATLEDELYNADGETLLQYVQAVPDSADTVLLVAHMPGVAELLAILASNPADGTIMFSAGMLVCVALEGPQRWAEVGAGSGAVEWLLPPLVAP